MTAVYAKVDRSALSQLALPGPGVSHERPRRSGQRLPGAASLTGLQLAAHHRLLPQFVEFLDQRQATVITTALALEWATQPAGSVVWWHQRLAVVAGFARYLQASDPRHEVPPADLVPAKFRRAIPYLYSESDVAALMAAARGSRHR